VPNRRTTEAALLAERAVAEAKGKGQPLAKEVLAECMVAFRNLAFAHEAGSKAFQRWAVLAVDTAKALAPYESPQYQAIAIATPPPPIQDTEPVRFTLRVFDRGHEVEPMTTRRIGGINGANHRSIGAEQEGGGDLSGAV
jgi:hypothetical protein